MIGGKWMIHTKSSLYIRQSGHLTARGDNKERGNKLQMLRPLGWAIPFFS